MDEYSLAVIIPNYNKGKYISRCIMSVLKQTYLPDEIVVVDDSSTDESVEIVRKLQESNPIIKLVMQPSNQGVSKARNAGANNTDCKYVTFLDSDDVYYNENKIDNEMQIIKKHHKRGSDVIAYSPCVLIDKDDQVVSKLPLVPILYKQGKCYIFFLSNYISSTIPRDYCMSKSAFFDVGGYSYYKDFYEDLDLVIRLSRLYKFYCTFEYGTGYRQIPGGLSKRNGYDHRNTVKEIKNNYLSNESVLFRLIVKLLHFFELVTTYTYLGLKRFFNSIVNRSN